MAAYVDYTYYSTSYLGTSIAESAFPALALKASAWIDALTYGRAATDTANTNAIKNATCAIAEELQRQTTQPDGITSQSQAQYSVSFASNSSAGKTNDQKLRDAAKLYLSNTFLMFAGFNSGEYGGQSDDS